MRNEHEDARVGSVIAGKYELISLLGRGGSSAVYEARHQKTDGRYALKLLEAPEGSEEAKRMLREARALAKLAHPNIVRLIDFDVFQGDVFIVEELLRGRTLRAALDEALVLSAREALEWLVPVLRALAYAHGQGVIHRDIKPENIVLCDEGGAVVPRVVDFGLVRELSSDTALTRHNTLLGTPRYMSPEQAWGRLDVDARSDLWSFGAVLYECLAGVAPYEGDNEREVLAAIVSKDPVHLRSAAVAVDEALADAVMYALERAPEARCPSAAALEQRLSAIASFAGEPWFEALFAATRAKGGDVAGSSASYVSDPIAETETDPGIEEPRAQRTSRASVKQWLVAAVALLSVGVALAASLRDRPTPSTARDLPVAARARDAGGARDDVRFVAASEARSDAADNDAHDFNVADVTAPSLARAPRDSGESTEDRAARARVRDAAARAPVYPVRAPDVISHGANSAPIVNEL
ncbi:MAG: serine/threonine protein kinase [Myxococcales bacterium]|nr:serine/threonine protein kinase [Myxococcales bacterium]